jgi:valyl-tRNA synthetase
MVAPLNDTKTCRSIEGLSEECRANVESILSNTETLKEIIAGVRNIRASKNIPQKECLTLYFNSADRYECAELLKKLANVELADSKLLSTLNAQLSTFIVGTTEFAIPMDAFINVDEEIKKLEADLQHQQGFLRGVQAKLSNERFVQNAKPEIVELERKKEHDALARIEAIENQLKQLRS